MDPTVITVTGEEPEIAAKITHAAIDAKPSPRRSSHSGTGYTHQALGNRSFGHEVSSQDKEDGGEPFPYRFVHVL